MAAAAQRPKLVTVVGQTASGKTALALQIAKEFNGEVIAADSWTVYKGFNIGTAKPSKLDQKEVKHHLLDIRETRQGFNAPLFKKLAEAAIRDIQGRGKLPILVGGTGLYIDSVLLDYGFLPGVSRRKRAALEALGLPDLIQKAEEDGTDLSGVDTKNKRRIIRAIEAKGQKPTKKDLRPDVLVIGIKVDPQELKERIKQRTDQMLIAGLKNEVKELAVKYGWDQEPMKGVGYQQWREYFEGTQSLEQTRQRIVSATEGLAKRQYTWLKRNKFINWFKSPEQAYKYIKQQLNT